MAHPEKEASQRGGRMNEPKQERKWRERFSGAKRNDNIKPSGKRHQLRNSPEGVTILADSHGANLIMIDRHLWELESVYANSIIVRKRK